MSDLNLALRLSAQDQASRVVNSARDNINKANKDIENQARRSATAQQNEVSKTVRITEQGYRRTQQTARTAAAVREQLGIRSEKLIQREINQTIAAYIRHGRF